MTLFLNLVIAFFIISVTSIATRTIFLFLLNPSKYINNVTDDIRKSN